MTELDKKVKKVTLPDGRVVSRQYAHYLKNGEEYRIKASEYSKRYRSKPETKEKYKSLNRAFRDKFFETHGIKYSTWYAMERRKNGNKE